MNMQLLSLLLPKLRSFRVRQSCHCSMFEGRSVVEWDMWKGLMYDAKDVTGIDFQQLVLSLRCSVEFAVARKQAHVLPRQSLRCLDAKCSTWFDSKVRLLSSDTDSYTSVLLSIYCNFH